MSVYAIEQAIIDGDWGGDEAQLTAVLLANPDKVKVIGATCVFGNTNHNQVWENARNIMHFFNADHIKVYPGAKNPSDTAPLEGDGAHGSHGIGNVALEKSEVPYEEMHSIDFILEQLRSNDPGTISITASGPLTNIAEAFRQNSEVMKNVKRVIIMGGCTHDIKAHDVPVRRGNISHFAEFNFQQAAIDAKTVMESGLPITLLPMNCTHQLTVTPERQSLIATAFTAQPQVGGALLKMMMAPAPLDRAKFNSDAVMHDIHCALYLLFPDSYVTEPGRVEVLLEDGIEWPFSKKGHTVYAPHAESKIIVATSVRDPDRLFAEYLRSITKILLPESIVGF